MIFVDTNVILDVVTDDIHWSPWSLRQLESASYTHQLIINDTVFAELSVGYPRIEDINDLLNDWGLHLIDTPREALFLAGKAFLQYRQAGGSRTGVLPDFFIGAHAAILDIPLLTREKTATRPTSPHCH